MRSPTKHKNGVPLRSPTKHNKMEKENPQSNAKETPSCLPVGVSQEQLNQMALTITQCTGISEHTMYFSKLGLLEKVIRKYTSDNDKIYQSVRNPLVWRWFLGVWYLNDLHINHYIISLTKTLDPTEYYNAQLELFTTRHKMPKFLL